MDFLTWANTQTPSLLKKLGDIALLDGRSVRGLYGSAFTGPRLSDIPTDITEPSFYMALSELGSADRGSALVMQTPVLLGDGQSTVSGALFSVSRLEPDGAGMVTLILRFESAP